ncbi:MAG: DUF1697 domain-containing protein [Euryarchaeota archaeon]|nr:DUF1697 domain-containing protein [Euryarchaeota archaeon]
MRYVALLRGINVGGNHLIKMSDLKRAFESAGFSDVETVIASGNVLFSAPKGSHEARIETALSKAFAYDARVLVRSEAQLRQTVRRAPQGWPRNGHRCYVVFVKTPLTPARLLRVAPPRPGVDAASSSPGAVYYETRMDARTRSGLQKLLVTPEYKLATIRNFASCSKVLKRMGD